MNKLLEVYVNHLQKDKSDLTGWLISVEYAEVYLSGKKGLRLKQVVGSVTAPRDLRFAQTVQGLVMSYLSLLHQDYSVLSQVRLLL